MVKYEVKITDEALEDMEKIYEYIANELLAPGDFAGAFSCGKTGCYLIK